MKMILQKLILMDRLRHLNLRLDLLGECHLSGNFFGQFSLSAADKSSLVCHLAFLSIVCHAISASILLADFYMG